jgi:DNA mismatch repair ATPase MutL
MVEGNRDLFEVQYEQGYLNRSTPGGITKVPDIALTELIANAHDAGATSVKIQIPSEKGQALTIEDNGIGMTAKHFKNRWMTLSYDTT